MTWLCAKMLAYFLFLRFGCAVGKLVMDFIKIFSNSIFSVISIAACDCVAFSDWVRCLSEGGAK